MEFTSQVGQDKWVCEFFNYKKNGYFIDLGANDGIWLSNTYYLEKELGWKGLCIEPGQTPFNALRSNRSCTCLRKFISDSDGVRDFEEIHYSRAWKGGIQEVESARLDTLLPLYDVPGLIDYISLDVDGPEYEILTAFPFKSYEVILWTIEHNCYLSGPGLKDKIKDLMESKGYVIAVENVAEGNFIFEDWYVNKKYYNRL